MRPLYPATLYKYDWRLELFLKKYENQEPFEMTDGSFVTFQFDQTTYNSLQNKDVSKITFTSNGEKYRFKHIGKSAEFGGGSDGLTRETSEIDNIKSAIEQFGSLQIEHNQITHTIVDCVSTPGYPKSDFHLVNEHGDDSIWISHKWGTEATHFQQWGGISKLREPDIHEHPEVQEFVHDLQEKYPEGLPNKTTVFRRIQDDTLKMMSVYGNAYGSGIEGTQNVSYVVQGSVSVEDKAIKAHRVHTNGQAITGAFEPVLSAVYKGDRSDCGVKNTRLGIIPYGSRAVTKYLK
jgi:hypothetical protein